MRHRGVRAVLLGEDDEHLRFARRALIKLGFNKNKMRLCELPAGHGAGDQHVRTTYAAEVRELRRKPSSQRALLVLIDADTNTVDQRRQQLNRELSNAELKPRGDNEAVILWIPKRNIETWLMYLAGRDVNEEDDYKHVAKRFDPRDQRKSAERFATLIQDENQRTPGTPDSMVKAFEESRRIPSSR